MHHRLAHRALARHQNQERKLRLQRDQLKVPDARGIDLRRGNDRDIAGNFGQHGGRKLGPFVELSIPLAGTGAGS